MLDEVMKEPAYILENGTPVPYVPVEVKTARDAYAASLHVLFKHVADFHICIVRTFSTKYGIPEDEILKTIQESEEFKNMKVDPVLDTDQLDTLGYLQPQPVPDPLKEVAAVKKKPVVSKAKKVKEPVAEPIVVAEDEKHDPVPATNVATNVATNAVEEQEPIKPKTIRKKVVQKSAVTPPPPPSANLFETNELHATNVIAANTNGTLQAQVLETVTRTEEPEPIKVKTIRKKVVQTTAVAPATNPVAPATNPVAPATNPVAPATTGDTVRKIIKKKTPIATV